MDNKEQIAILQSKYKELINQNKELSKKILKLEGIIKRLIKEIHCYIDIIEADAPKG